MFLDYPRHDNLKAWEFQAQPHRHMVRDHAHSKVPAQSGVITHCMQLQLQHAAVQRQVHVPKHSNLGPNQYSPLRQYLC
jgi:hypothetical protein